MITSKDTAVKAEGKQGLYSYVHLIGGTEREKAVFANCIMELFGNVDNQRYLLKAKGRVPKLCKYYSVPELFAKKKEDAMRFQSCMKKQIGYYELVYTRNPEGRKVLLDARIHSLANKYEKKMNKKKKVKGEFE